MAHIEAIDMAEADANAEDRPTVAAQQDGGLVAELLAIDEAAMYERPATTRATIERAATALAEKDAQYERLAGRMDAMAADNQRLRAECEGLRAAFKKTEYSLTKDSLCEAEKIDDALYVVRAALSQKETGDAA